MFFWIAQIYRKDHQSEKTQMSQDDQKIRDQLMESLKTRSQDDLASLAAELMYGYVVQKKEPMVEQIGMLPVPADLRETSFVQLVIWLKKNLSHPELEYLQVDDEKVFVKIGDHLQLLQRGEFQGTPTAPPSPGPATEPASPTASRAVEAPISSPPTMPPHTPAADKPTQEPNTSDDPLSERFSMLEID